MSSAISKPPFQAIQMIGTQRSGSNLLRVMLNQLPEIYAPHPPHILHIFYPLLDHYGNLGDDKNFKKLIEDVCCYIQLNPVPWENADLNPKKIFSLCNRRTLLELFIKINELQCIEKGKTTWCCKSMETIYFIDNFDKEDFKPFVIYLVRDGRDVAASFRKIIVGEKSVYHLAMKWKNEQAIALKYLSKLSPENYVIIKYENFIAEPSKFIEEICLKLKINFDSSVLSYYNSDESHRTAESGKMWENVARPVIKNNTNKFIKELSHYDIQVFETVAGDMLEELGYKRTISPAEEIIFSAGQLKDFETENQRLKKSAVQSASAHDVLQRKPQKEFIENLKRNFGSAMTTK